jgi:Luciferase-like monooxygenase
VVDFAGRFDRVDRAALVPKPGRPIPIWLGGSSEAAFDRAARLADGFIFFEDMGRVINDWARMRDRLDGLGRSVEAFGREYVVHPQGSLDDLASEVERWRAAGGTHLSVVTMGRGLDSADDHIDYLASVAAALDLH